MGMAESGSSQPRLGCHSGTLRAAHAGSRCVCQVYAQEFARVSFIEPGEHWPQTDPPTSRWSKGKPLHRHALSYVTHLEASVTFSSLTEANLYLLRVNISFGNIQTQVSEG